MNHSVLLTKDGSVYSWGNNKYGELGLGKPTVNKFKLHIPTKIDFFDNLKSKPVNIACGEDRTFVILESGEIYGFGFAEGCRLGLKVPEIDNKEVPEITTPVKLPDFPSLKGRKVIAIDCGTTYNILIAKKTEGYKKNE